ncbi:MAG: hypothetical protein ACYDA5_05865 [Vulcanimicrobiaceae bacterium]
MDNDAWRTVVFDVLRDLGGDEIFVPGSRIMSVLVLRASDKGDDLRSYLRSQRMNLGRFLKQFEPSIEVRNKGASDMLVGFPGAKEKRVEQPRAFRKDVFDAFSKFGQSVYYAKTRDQFVADPVDTAGLISGPSITKDTVLADRVAFAQTQPEPLRIKLLTAASADSPLSAFMKIVVGSRIQKDWQRFRSLRVLERVNQWASNNNIDPPSHWFKKMAVSDVSPRALLQGLIQQMTDEEIRDLRVSVRAIESLVRRGRFQVERE